MKTQSKSPQLDLELDADNYQRAVSGSSGGCLVADEIKRKYPKFSNVKVDVVSVGITDRERGVRYIYMTPASARDTLLFFDQGIPEPTLPKKMVIRGAVKILPIVRSKSNLKLKAERRAARLAELEAKEQGAESLTRDEKRALTQLRNPKKTPVRPTGYGRKKVAVTTDHDTVIGTVVHGGAPDGRARDREKHPNLLAGRDRIFGAKMAKPGEVYKLQLEKEVAEKVEERVAAEREKIRAEFEAKKG